MTTLAKLFYDKTSVFSETIIFMPALPPLASDQHTTLQLVAVPHTFVAAVLAWQTTKDTPRQDQLNDLDGACLLLAI